MNSSCAFQCQERHNWFPDRGDTLDEINTECIKCYFQCFQQLDKSHSKKKTRPNYPNSKKSVWFLGPQETTK